MDKTQIDQHELEQFEADAHEVLMLRDQRKKLETLEGKVKKRLMEFLEKYGEPYGEEGQHHAVELDPPIRGIGRLVRQTKSSVRVDETEAEAIARSYGIYERLFKQVWVLDEDAVMVALAEGLLGDDEVDRIFPRKVMYAFVPEKLK